MSRFTNDELNRMTLIGHTDTHGKAWWGGGHFSGSVPFDEAVKLLDWVPEEVPVFEVDIDEPMGFRQVPGKKLVKHPHTGHHFGVFNDSWKAHIYKEWCLDNLVTILDASEGTLDVGSVLCLGNGEQAVVQVRPPEGVTVGGERLLPWLAAFSSMDQSWATGYKAVATRIVCDNTAEMAYRERRGQHTYKVKHTRNSQLRIAEAREMIGMMWAQVDDFVTEVDQLMNTEITRRQFDRIISTLVPIPDDEGRSKTMAENKDSRIRSLYTHDMRVAPYAGTAWGVVQAFNTYTHHYQTVRNVTRTDRSAIATIDGTIGKADRDVVATIDKVLADA